MQLLPGALVGRKYVLERPLACGGMGSVWVARHAQLDITVAVKFIHPTYAGSPMLRARFEREARASAKISSAHVVHVHDYGVEEDTPYLVMELLEGEDLGVRLKREGRISMQEAAHIAVQTAKGLRRAHEAGFVHRDLKPSNIFLARSDDEEIVKILDFGVAKHTAAPLGESTKTGEIMGSPHYMSPEQIHESKNIDSRSDLWSLAVILFRAVTGELPFPGEAFGVVMAKVLTDPIPLPSQIVSGLPPALDAFFLRAFNRDPAQRFQTARETAEEFSRAACGARAPSPSWSMLHSPLPGGGGGGDTMDSSPPSSTIPVGLDRTLQSAPELREAMAGHTPPATLLMEPQATPGPMSTTVHAFEPAAHRIRKPLLWWGVGAAGLAGAALGWVALAVLVGGAPSPALAQGAGHLIASANASALVSDMPRAVTAIPDPSALPGVAGGSLDAAGLNPSPEGERDPGAADASRATSTASATAASSSASANGSKTAARPGKPPWGAKKRPRLGF